MTPTNNNDKLIEIAELQHQYDGKTVLSLDEWALNKGENQLLLGPSGSGKTTLLSILSGLLTPTSGKVRVQGKSLYEMTSSEQDNLRASTFGLVFQDHHLVSSLTLADNLAFAQHFAGHKADDAWVSHLLVRLGLSDKINSKPDMLSRGEAQRAALARAAICQPPIMIADEPTSALDDENTAEVAALLSELCKEFDATLLVASHDARLIQYFDQKLQLSKTGSKAA